MDIFLTALHVMVCLILVVVVLLQHGKGADMGAMLGGGGANTVFGSRGAGNFLTKITNACAVIFMVTSLTLSYMGNLGEEDLIFGGEAIEEPAPDAADGLEEIPVPIEGGAEAEPSANALEEIPLPDAVAEPAPSEAEAPVEAAPSEPATP